MSYGKHVQIIGRGMRLVPRTTLPACEWALATGYRPKETPWSFVTMAGRRLPVKFIRNAPVVIAMPVSGDWRELHQTSGAGYLYTYAGVSVSGKLRVKAGRREVSA